MPNLIYEGAVRIDSTSKAGDPLIVKSGPNKGKPWYKISFKDDSGVWINLQDFKGHAGEIASGSVCKVAYAPKVDEFGDPVLYNGLPEYTLQGLKATGAPLTPHSGASSPSAAPGSFNARNLSIEAQVSVKNASAHLTALAVSADEYTLLLPVLAQTNMETITHLITGKDELDALMDKAKDTLTDDIEMPGPDAEEFPEFS